MGWERLPDESSKAFHAFSLYRDMGPTRSLQKVALELPKSLPLIKRWCARHDWVSRVRAFEDRNEMIRREAREVAEREDAAARAERENEHRERIFQNEERAAILEAELLDRFEQMLEELLPVRYALKPATPDLVLAIRRLHEIAARSVPVRLEAEEEARRCGLSQAEREELDELANDPELGPQLGQLFRRLFPQELPDEGDDTKS